MSLASVLYLIGSFLFFSAERFFSTDDVLRYALWALSGLLSLMALGWVGARMGEHRRAATAALGFYGLSMASLLPYAMVVMDVFGSDKGGRQLETAATAAIPLLWALGALPAMNLSRTIHANPKSVHPLRMLAAWEGGLAVALGLGMLFPINYLAQAHNEKWDFGFFRTTDAGEGTRLVVENLTDPMNVYLFFPANSEVLREVEGYFDQIKGPNLIVEVVDQAMDPALAKKYNVKENGTIALVRGERRETVKLGDEFSKAQKELRKLDTKIHTALLKLGSDKKTAYFTVGHDEMFWKNAPKDDEKIDLAKTFLEGLNFKVKELGLEDGLGQEVPEDAAVLFVVGAKKPFLPSEVRAIENYRNKGGSVYLMLEPGQEQVDQPLLDLFGVEYNNATMVTDKARGYAYVTGGLSDRSFVMTNKFSSHESISILSKRNAELTMVVPSSGGITEKKDHVGKYTVVVKGMPDWFADLDGDYEFDKDTEKRGQVDIAAVLTGPADGGKEWRAVVVGDATWLSNVVVMQVVGNQAFYSETVGWLAQDPSIGGEQESEEDVKIQHTKEGQQYWFLGASVVVPGLVMLLGTLNVMRRRSR